MTGINPYDIYIPLDIFWNVRVLNVNIYNIPEITSIATIKSVLSILDI